MSRAESQARTRRLLLQSASKVFAKRGYTAATIDEISEKAGFSRGAFYANFADKAEIFLTIIETQQQQDFADLAGRINVTPDHKVLDVMGEWFFRTLVNAPLGRALDEFRLVAQDTPALRKRLADFTQADIDLSAEMLSDYCHRHNVTLKVPPATFAGLVTALITGYKQRLTIDSNVSSAQEIGVGLEAFWTALSEQPKQL